MMIQSDPVCPLWWHNVVLGDAKNGPHMSDVYVTMTIVLHIFYWVFYCLVSCYYWQWELARDRAAPQGCSACQGILLVKCCASLLSPGPSARQPADPQSGLSQLNAKYTVRDCTLVHRACLYDLSFTWDFMQAGLTKLTMVSSFFRGLLQMSRYYVRSRSSSLVCVRRQR